MNAPCSGAPLTAPHVTTAGLCRWKAINKEGRHVGLDFYDLLIEGDFISLRRLFAFLEVKTRNGEQLMAIHLDYRKLPCWKLAPICLDNEPHRVSIPSVGFPHCSCTC